MKSFWIFLSALVIAKPLALLGQGRSLEPRGKDNIAFMWGKVAMDCTANDTERFRPRPTVTSRYLGLIWTAVFDAWSRYDRTANPLYLKDIARRPASEATVRNKEIAISFAAFHTMMVYFISDSSLLKKQMRDLGLNPDEINVDPTTPAGIGTMAAKTVVDARMFDGANQSGTVSGSDGRPYADYTSYRPVNSVDSLIDLKRWQPKYFSDGKGGKFAPACLTPQWNRVRPLLLDSADQFRPVAPPAIHSAKLNGEIRQIVSMQANLTNEQKGLIEFMRDGPKSVQQAGHWFVFAQAVSERDQHTLDQDVNMYFLVEAAAMDAFIACWDSKMFYDFARPYSLVHDYYKDQTITLWGGPDKGMIQAKGGEWRPYSPETFLCPPFPSYVSGHSTVSAACAEVLRLFTGSDRFGEKVKRVPGEFTEPDHIGDTITLQLNTFSGTARLAGLSRVLGGYHIPSENVEGLKLGKNVAGVVWKKYRRQLAPVN